MYLLPEELMDSADREVWTDLLAMLGHSRNPVAKVLMCNEGLATTRSDSETLNKEIIAAKKTQKAAYPYLKCLVKWIEWVNSTHNLEICISNVPVYTKPPLSPFTDEVRVYPADYRQYMDILLTACGKELSPEAEIGRAICSATLLGGLHHKYLVRALMRVLPEPIPFLSGHVWYNLEVVNRDDEALERRIWEPDPLSEIFLLNLSNEAVEHLRTKINGEKKNYPIERLLGLFMKAAGMPPMNVPTFEKLRKTANYVTALRSPLHAGYYRREFICHSLIPEVWERILGMPRGYTTPSITVEKRLATDDPDNYVIEIESHWYHELRKLVLADAGEDALYQLRDKFENEGFGYGPTLMVEWCVDMLKPDADTKRSKTVDAARRSLTVAGKYLVSHSDGVDISNLDENALAELYETVIESAMSPNHLRNLKKGLKRFHQFLRRTYAANDIADVELFRNSGILPVDATIISEDEFQQVRSRIYTEPTFIRKSRKLPWMYDVILTLAYRTGMRRREILYLNRSDLIPSNRRNPESSEEVDLLVRPNYIRRLKTDSSKRRLPLHALLDEDELRMLIKWWALRESEEQDGVFSTQLFAIRELGWGTLEQEPFIAKLHELMRDELGDNTIRFHHLRHSAASWISLRLMAADMEDVPTLFVGQPRTQARLENSKLFRGKLYKNNNMTRRHIYATAAILGHSSPEITLEHYLHTIDLIADKVRVKMPLKALVKASNIPEPSLYRRGMKNNPSVIQAMSRERAVKAGRLVDLSAIAETQKIERDQTLFAQQHLRTVWSAVTAFSHDSTIAMAEIATQYNLEHEYLERIVERARYLSELPANQLNTLKTDTFRHNPNNLPRGLKTVPPMWVPDWPRQKFARYLVSKYAPNVIDLSNHPIEMLAGGRTVGDVVDYVMEHSWRSKYEIYFKDQGLSDYAISYCDLLRRIGIDDSDIEYRTVLPRSKKGCGAGVWCRILGLSKASRIKHVARTWNDDRRQSTGISIKPVFMQFKSREDNDINNQESASHGVYLLLYLLDCMIAGRR